MLTARAPKIVTAALFALALGGCSGEGKGAAQIFVEPEDTITQGLEAGVENENIHDGWSVKYTRFLVVVGHVRASRSDTMESVADPGVHVLDLLGAPASGYVVAELTDLGAARWDRFGFDLPNAAKGAVPLAPTTDADAFPIPAYNLSGALGGPIHSAYDYVLAEMRTIGHFQGDGDCPTRAVLP